MKNDIEKTCLRLVLLDKKDIEEALPIYINYLRYFGITFKESRLRKLVSDLLGEDWFRFFLAKNNETTVGFCVVTKTYSPVSCCFAYNLTDLFVCENYRSMGYGTLILTALEKRAARECVGKLFVNADPKSIPFYEKNEWNQFHFVYHYKIVK